MNLRVFVLAALCMFAKASYLPGVVPKDYNPGHKLQVLTSQLTSKHMHTRFDFYEGTHNCPPDGFKTHKVTFGEALSQETWLESPYVLEMGKNVKCASICRYEVTAADIHRYQILGGKGFEYRLSLDDLPSATLLHQDEALQTANVYYADGIPVVVWDQASGKTKVYNHLNFIVETHETNEGLNRIVGFDVEPLSVDWGYSHPCLGFGDEAEEKTIHDAVKQLGERFVEESWSFTFTYSVKFKTSPLEWAHRLDHYKKLGNEKIHHSQVMLAAGIICALSFVVCRIICGVLGQDIQAIQRNLQKVKQNRQQHYSQISTSENRPSQDSTQLQVSSQLARFTSDIQLEFVGWKRISGEVFRKPFLALVLSVLIGSSAQITLVVLTLTFYSMQSTLDVDHRTQIYSFAFTLTVLTGLLAGYLSARFYKFFNGTSWLRCASATALFIPSIFAFYFVVIDIVDWWERTLATPFSMMSLVLFCWVLLNALTIFIGSWLGFVRAKIEVPAKPSRIQRAVSEAARNAPFYTSKLVTVPIGSFLCFACIGTEIFYLVTSVWRQSYYMMFLYLMLSLLLMAIVAVQVSIIQTYLLLKHEIAQWWWASFLIGGGVSFWILLLSYDYYFFLEKGYGFGSFVIFSGAACWISLAIGMMAGFFSFIGSYFFVRNMYTRAGSKVE